ncbi:hypothetical protein PUN28_013010 [Cardiocondyla obscurior]|uniref:Transmembrane protein n=1 Tax=Cardiocondyla obscurior TaxID=286306 RepID=A0AAW2F7R5_9HYME
MDMSIKMSRDKPKLQSKNKLYKTVKKKLYISHRSRENITVMIKETKYLKKKKKKKIYASGYLRRPRRSDLKGLPWTTLLIIFFFHLSTSSFLTSVLLSLINVIIKFSNK